VATQTSIVTLKSANGVEDRLEVRFNLAAVDWYEQNSGSRLFAGLTTDMGLRSIIFLLQAGLRYKTDITYDQVRDKIQNHLDNGGDLPSVNKQVLKALKFAGVLPREEGDQFPPTQAPQ
jgi:hypothetical protein